MFNHKLIDFTDLRPEATKKDIEKLIKIAIEQGYGSVCVNPCYTKFAKNFIHNLEHKVDLKVVTVIGYPLGASVTSIKAREAEQALFHDSDELDIVMNIGAFKEKDYEYVNHDLTIAISMCKHHNRVSKIIIETGLLTEFEIVKAAHLVKELGANFIKTCTSSKYGPVNMDHIRTIRRAEPTLAIKASGGIKTLEQLGELCELGVSRIGTSSVIISIIN